MPTLYDRVVRSHHAKLRAALPCEPTPRPTVPDWQTAIDTRLDAAPRRDVWDPSNGFGDF